MHLFLTERLRIFNPSLRVARERYRAVVPKLRRRKLLEKHVFVYAENFKAEA